MPKTTPKPTYFMSNAQDSATLKKLKKFLTEILEAQNSNSSMAGLLLHYCLVLENEDKKKQKFIRGVLLSPDEE